MKRWNRMGKLGAGSQDVTAVVIDIAALDTGGDVVNGPEELLDWEAIDWRHQERQVQRLRQRIFKATQAGDDKQARNLQKLMVRHEARVFRTGVKDRRRLIVVAVG